MDFLLMNRVTTNLQHKGQIYIMRNLKEIITHLLCYNIKKLCTMKGEIIVSDNNPMMQDLVFTRVLTSPVEEVWKAWSNPEYIIQWWGPDGFTCPQAKMDFREGGISLVCMRAPKEYGGQDFYNSWTYKSIMPMQQIEFISHSTDKDGNKLDPDKLGMPSDKPKEVRHLVVFKELGNGKTELTVTEYNWTVGRMMEMSKMGMEQCLKKMAAIFTKS
jgi:uncharacterized protein YndB with AHSA1/START domain